MEQLIGNIKQQPLSESEHTEHIKWELLSTKFVNLQSLTQKAFHTSARRSQCKLEKELKELESNLNSEASFNEYTQNVKRTLNLFIRENVNLLKLEANVNGMKKVKNQLSFFLI